MSEAPERIYMDPDIKFPECEKQYGCDIEYVRADMLHEIFLRYSKAETRRIKELEDRLAKAVEALQQLVIEYDEVDLAHDEPESMTAAYVVARTTLAELKGGKDE